VEEAFWIFVHILYVKNYRVIYKKEFPKLVEMVNYLDAQIQEKIPEIAILLNEKKVMMDKMFDSKYFDSLKLSFVFINCFCLYSYSIHQFQYQNAFWICF